jgi:hypothetical protein
MPVNSWPITGWKTPAVRIEGPCEAYSWRSEPQMPQLLTSITTSPAAGVGSGASRSSILPGPTKATVFTP